MTKRADAEYEKLTLQQKKIIQKIFVLRLIQPGEGTEDTRRRATIEELLATGENTDVTSAILKQWTDTRLLTTMADPLKKQEMVEVAHEVLIRKWCKLQEWLAQKRETARLIDQLHKATDEWIRANKNNDYLYHGAQLAQVEDLFKSPTMYLTPHEVEFIQESINERDREIQLWELQRQRELEAAQHLARASKSANKRLWVLAAVVAFALLMVSFLSLKLKNSLKESNRQLTLNY